jgi:hypothetical protein
MFHEFRFFRVGHKDTMKLERKKGIEISFKSKRGLNREVQASFAFEGNLNKRNAPIAFPKLLK